MSDKPFNSTLIIDDEPNLKAIDRGLDIKKMLIATTIQEGIVLLSSLPKLKKIYIDYNLPDGKGTEILTWLSEHLDKVPDEIISSSFSCLHTFQGMIDSLLVTARRESKEVQK